MRKGTRNRPVGVCTGLVLAVLAVLGLGLATPFSANAAEEKGTAAADEGTDEAKAAEAKASDDKAADDKDEKSGDQKSSDEKSSDEKSSDEKSGDPDAKAPDEPSGPDKAPAEEKPADKKPSGTPAEDAQKPAAQGGGAVTSYGVAVSGSSTLAPTPTLKLDACPDKDTAAAAKASAPSVLSTGAIALGADCARQDDGSNMVRSRADVSSLKITTDAGDLVAASVSTACVSAGKGSRAAVTISGLTFNGKAVGGADLAPNTDLSTLADGLSGTANEQIRKGTRLSAHGLKVEAGDAVVIVGHVECDTSLGAAPAAPPAAAPEADDAAAPAAPKAKEGKGLANTGASSMLTLLAFGALASGMLLRVGGDGAAVLVPSRFRRRPGRPAGVYRPASTWDPSGAADAGRARLDGAALDALKALEDR